MNIDVEYSIIVPTYNNQDTIKECIIALKKQTVPKNLYEIIIVNDGSNDKTVEILTTISDIKVISIENSGPAVARNIGVKYAKGSIVVFTDADCKPVYDWLEQMVSSFENEDIIAVKGIYKSEQKELVSRFVQREYEFKYERMKKQKYIDFVDTYSAAYRKDGFLANNGFDENFRRPSVEDQELSFRLARKGYHMIFQPNAKVFHTHDKSLQEYWQRKKDIGYWKAFMLRWLPEKTTSDSHTSPSQRAQIILLFLFIISLIGVIFFPLLLYIAISSLIIFYMIDLKFQKFILTSDIDLLTIYPVIVLVRAAALGFGLVKGVLIPPTHIKNHRSFQFYDYFLKRFIDIIGGIVGLILGFPFLLLAAIIIKLDSPGPIIFSQLRAGVNGKPYRIFKLRTMVIDAENQLDLVLQNNQLKGPVFKIPNDPRITKAGKFLRKWSIDEIPQFWNVIIGDMSLVGPRPEEIWVVMRYNDEQRKRLAVKPGLTGLMQINGRGDLDFDDRQLLDLDYINNRSLILDMKILFQSIYSVLFSKGAY